MCVCTVAGSITNNEKPGSPNADTWGGSGSMMEINYVAHYVST
jgi:hypothetical protein